MPTLNWLSREADLKAAAAAEYRLLVESPELSYSASDNSHGYTQMNTDKNQKISVNPCSSVGDNLLVHGDNLEALKALLPFYAGQVKCVYIDPPYNTGSAFEHYDDNMEHTIWLSMMYPRLELLKKFLREDGAIFIQIDENEDAYLKVICDEIFGRTNRVCTFIWHGRAGQGGTASQIAETHEYIVCYAKNITNLNFKKKAKIASEGKYQDDKGSYKREQLRQWGQGVRREDRPTMYYPVIYHGFEIFPKLPDGSDGRWRVGKPAMDELVMNGDVDFVSNHDGTWSIYKKIREGRVTQSAYTTILEDCGTASTATLELKALFAEKVFATPKPEALLRHIISLSTDEGDIVMDTFAGSGTTGSVAHKMNRRYILGEMNGTIVDVVAPRLKKVIEGEQGGISKAVNWTGGGGFRFFTLGDAVFDTEGHINPKISFKNLAAHIWFTETKTPINSHRFTQIDTDKNKNISVNQCSSVGDKNISVNQRSSVGDNNSTFLGIHNGVAYALLYNGILKDRSIDGGNVLTHKTLTAIMKDIDGSGAEPADYGKIVIYGEATRLPHVAIKQNNIEFKQTPYDIKVW